MGSAGLVDFVNHYLVIIIEQFSSCFAFRVASSAFDLASFKVFAITAASCLHSLGFPFVAFVACLPHLVEGLYCS